MIQRRQAATQFARRYAAIKADLLATEGGKVPSSNASVRGHAKSSTNRRGGNATARNPANIGNRGHHEQRFWAV